MAVNTSSTGTSTGRTVVGLFHDRADAESAIQDLKRAGFTNEQVGVAMRDRGKQRDLAQSTDTEAATGAATGAISGGIVGGLIGLLGSLLIPGVGPVVAGGVLASTLVGAGAGAATGGIIGALVGMGLSEEEATHFDAGFRQGAILVTVNAGARTNDALGILRMHHADLGPTQMAGRERTAAAGSELREPMGQAGEEARRNIELRGEELEVEKRRREAGEVRVRKEVVSEQRSIDVPVSREELVVERHPAAPEKRAASGDLGAPGSTEETRIPLREEEVEVHKRPVVREEVSLGKREVQQTEHLDETVRHEELEVQSEGDVAMRPAGTSARGTAASGTPASGTPASGPRGNRPAYSGRERRRGRDASYAGPERRQATL